MTIVFIASSVDKGFLMMGDTLVSTSIEPTRINPLPFHKNATNIKSNYGTYIAGMGQKIHLINDHFVVGWAGSVIRARTAIREMDSHFKTKKFTQQEIFDFLNALKPDLSIHNEENDGIQIIGAVLEGNKYYKFRWDSKVGQKVIGEQPRQTIIGSGTDKIIKILDEMGEVRVTGDANKTVQFVLSVMSALLSDLGASIESLLSAYGGFFEVVGMKNNKFFKFSDYTIIFYEAVKPQDNCSFSMPLGAIKTFYNNNTMGIARELYEWKSPDEMEVKKEAWLIEGMLEYGVPKSEINVPDNLDFNSQVQINVFNADKISSGLIIPYAAGGNCPVEFRPDGLMLKIGDGYDRMLASVQKRIMENI